MRYCRPGHTHSAVAVPLRRCFAQCTVFSLCTARGTVWMLSFRPAPLHTPHTHTSHTPHTPLTHLSHTPHTPHPTTPPQHHRVQRRDGRGAGPQVQRHRHVSLLPLTFHEGTCRTGHSQFGRSCSPFASCNSLSRSHSLSHTHTHTHIHTHTDTYTHIYTHSRPPLPLGRSLT